MTPEEKAKERERIIRATVSWCLAIFGDGGRFERDPEYHRERQDEALKELNHPCAICGNIATSRAVDTVTRVIHGVERKEAIGAAYYACDEHGSQDIS